MAILDTYFKYNKTERFYYLTVLGAEKLSGVDTLDKDWNNAQAQLMNQGRLLKAIMIMSTNDNMIERCSRKDIIEYFQYKFEDKRNSVLIMLGQFAFWSWQNDADLLEYENPMSLYNALPITIKQEGRHSSMIYTGKTIFTVPEDEYQVGY